MNQTEFAQKLIQTPADFRSNLFYQNALLLNSQLAKSLRQICYEVWTSEPQKISIIAEVLRDLADFTSNPEFDAYREWTKAIENLVNGKLEDCLIRLDKSEQSFINLDLPHSAATTQISKLYALALLGRYNEAVECGLRARDVFIRENDLYSVGKIEHNIGNLYWRRDFYRESEPYLASAHECFEQIGDQRQLAMVENCQAFVAALQNNFREAETIYQQALRRAEENGLTVTEAEIEIGLSNLYLFQGRFDLALKFMEGSRQKYDLLEMPHQSAACELEAADIYLELNLLPEAVKFYEAIEDKFTRLGMKAELGRSLLNHAKALFLLNETESADNLLKKAETVFAAEGNNIAAAQVKLAKANSLFRLDQIEKARREIESALNTFAEGGNKRFQLFSNRLLGEILAKQNESEKAEKAFRETLKSAAGQSRQIEYLCLVSLGKVTGEEKYYRAAIDLIENLRSSLSTGEFRTAFFSDKLAPYNELVKIRLSEKNFAAALEWHERSRARTLIETNNGAGKTALNPKIAALRQELNWFYSRINRQTSSGLEARQQISVLRKEAEEREQKLAELERRLSINEQAKASSEINDFNLPQIQKHLSGTTVIEFASVGNNLSAFVITENAFEVIEYRVDLEVLRNEIEQFLFQIKTGRFLAKLSAENQRLSTERLLRRSQNIYDCLLQPLERFFDAKRLVFLPTSFLHYLPFQALHNGERFLIEINEISYAPSLMVLQNCLRRKISAFDSALLLGVADEATPLVTEEIETLGKLFKNSVRLKDSAATLGNLRKHLEAAEIVHLACHGNFRVDNPSFSSLNLFAENLTVRDVQSLNLQNKFIALSACETGLSKIYPGEELLGLTRALLHAGAGSLLLSLWTVNDRSTLELIRCFYRSLLNDNDLSNSLQTAQIEILAKNPHPYFWSPFVLVGGW